MDYKFENGNLIKANGKKVPVWGGSKINIKEGENYHSTTLNKYCLANFKEQYVEWKVAELKKKYNLNFKTTKYENYLISDSNDPAQLIFSLRSDKFIPPVYMKKGICYQISVNKEKHYEQKNNF